MQNVNLYLPELRPVREWVTLGFSLSVLLVMIVLFSAASIVQSNSLKEFESQVLLVEGQKLASTSRLAEYSLQAKKQKLSSLDDNISRLRQNINQRRAVKEFFQRQGLGNEFGYALRLEALSEHVPDGVAINRFRFSNGDKYTEFSGRVIQPKDVAVLLSHLGKNQQFQFSNFGDFSLGGETSGAGTHKFSVGFDSLFQEVAELK